MDTDAKVRKGLEEIKYSHGHPRFMAMAEVPPLPWWIPCCFRSLVDENAGKVGQVIDVQVGENSKKDLFTVFFEATETQGVYLEEQLDFESPKKLTGEERVMLGI